MSGNPILLFDLGGVLIKNNMFAELKQHMKIDQSEAELIELWIRNPVARQFELGQCSVDDFARTVVLEFGLDLSPDDFLAAFKGWPKGFYDGAEEMLALLRADYTVCCLSNSNEVHWHDTITDHFDFAFSSHLIGCIKPDREAFDHVLAEIDVRPNDVHFFDDAAINVEAARSYGLNGYHTVGYQNLVATLKDRAFLG